MAIRPYIVRIEFCGGNVGLLEETIKGIRDVDKDLMAVAQSRLDDLTKPKDSLGRLEEFAVKVVGITNDARPEFKRRIIFTLAGDHGVAREGVSLYPQEVTCQMVANFINGGAGINVLARHAGAEVVVVDMGVAGEISQTADRRPQTADKRLKARFVSKKINAGTKNIAEGPAMTRDEAVRAMEAGISVFNEEYEKQRIDIAGTGDMGIANTTASSAVIAAITGSPCRDVTGRGTGLGDQQLRLKISVIEKALEVNRPDPADAVDVLSKVGGFEIGGICGIILGAANKRTPVVIDGFISTAGALLAYGLAPLIKEYVFASHRSQENGHLIALEHLGCRPILDLNMRLGEGTGAALAMNLIEAGVRIHNEMATFSQAKVSDKDKSKK